MNPTVHLYLQAVGASGAIFGMVGAWGAFCLMNEAVLGRNNSQRALRNIGQTVMINVVYGMSSSQIDNMGHLGVRFDSCTLVDAVSSAQMEMPDLSGRK